MTRFYLHFVWPGFKVSLNSYSFIFSVFCRVLFCGHLQDLELLMSISDIVEKERKPEQSKSYFFLRSLNYFWCRIILTVQWQRENVAFFFMDTKNLVSKVFHLIKFWLTIKTTCFSPVPFSPIERSMLLVKCCRIIDIIK